VLELYVAVREVPFTATLEEETKLVPVTVNVNEAPPAVTGLGLSETIVGTGLVVGGGGLPPELPEPPPQPDKDGSEVRQATARIVVREPRKVVTAVSSRGTTSPSDLVIHSFGKRDKDSPPGR
jgi:hypothetical protein